MDLKQYDSESNLSDVAISQEFLWPQGQVWLVLEYDDNLFDRDQVILRDLLDDYQETLDSAKAELEENTSLTIHFIEDPSESDSGNFVNVLLSKDKYGRPTPLMGSATIGVGDEGLFVKSWGATAKHELGHVIGLHHTHNRSDRDEFVDIFWQAIGENEKRNYQLKISPYRDIGPYDFESIMHYDSFTFTNDINCASLLIKGSANNCGEANTSPYRIHDKTEYSTWNYTAITALYCLPKFCGDNCAQERCDTPKSKTNLKRYWYWESTNQPELPDIDPKCMLSGRDDDGDGFVDIDKERCPWETSQFPIQ